MIHEYHRRTILALITVMVLFALIFVAAMFALFGNRSLFGLGIPVQFEDIIIMVLSIASIIRVLIALIQIEHRKDLRI